MFEYGKLIKLKKDSDGNIDIFKQNIEKKFYYIDLELLELQLEGIYVIVLSKNYENNSYYNCFIYNKIRLINKENFEIV
jgi:hypothetical protein